jgi:hypothetical protein
VTEEAVEANKKYDDQAIASTATPDNLPADEVTVSTSSQIEEESQPIPQKPSAVSDHLSDSHYSGGPYAFLKTTSCRRRRTSRARVIHLQIYLSLDVFRHGWILVMHQRW